MPVFAQHLCPPANQSGDDHSIAHLSRSPQLRHSNKQPQTRIIQLQSIHPSIVSSPTSEATSGPPVAYVVGAPLGPAATVRVRARARAARAPIYVRRALRGASALRVPPLPPPKLTWKLSVLRSGFRWRGVAAGGMTRIWGSDVVGEDFFFFFSCGGFGGRAGAGWVPGCLGAWLGAGAGGR